MKKIHFLKKFASLFRKNVARPDRDRKTMLDLLTGDISQWIPGREKMLEQQVGFYYLWK